MEVVYGTDTRLYEARPWVKSITEPALKFMVVLSFRNDIKV